LAATLRRWKMKKWITLIGATLFFSGLFAYVVYSYYILLSQPILEGVPMPNLY